MSDSSSVGANLTKPAESLKLIYGVMAGVALTDAALEFSNGLHRYGGLFRALVHAGGLALVAMAVAFFATIVPFFHGAIGYIDTFPSSGIRNRLEQREFIVGFFLLFLEGAVLVGMALNLSHVLRLIEWFVFLISVDSVWAFWVLWCLRQPEHRAPIADILRETLVNFLRLNWFAGLPLAFILIIMRVKLWLEPGAATPPREICIVAILAAAILVTRTFIDYHLNGHIYAPIASPE